MEVLIYKTLGKQKKIFYYKKFLQNQFTIFIIIRKKDHLEGSLPSKSFLSLGILIPLIPLLLLID